MKLVFGILFLTATVALAGIQAYLFHESLNYVTNEDSYLKLGYTCTDVVTGGQVTLIFFLTVCAAALSFLPGGEGYFERLILLWSAVFSALGLMLLCSHFYVFQEQECESEISFWAKLLFTLTAMGSLAIATLLGESKLLGALFLLVAIALGTVLTLSLLSIAVDLSPYGYFCHIVFLLCLLAAGVSMILEESILGQDT